MAANYKIDMDEHSENKIIIKKIMTKEMFCYFVVQDERRKMKKYRMNLRLEVNYLPNEGPLENDSITLHTVQLQCSSGNSSHDRRHSNNKSISIIMLAVHGKPTELFVTNYMRAEILLVNILVA